MHLILIISYLSGVFAVPVSFVKSAAENDFEKFDNYLPKVEDSNKFKYSTLGKNTHKSDMLKVEGFASSDKESSRTLGDVVDFVKEGASAGMDLLRDVKDMFVATLQPESTTSYEDTTTFLYDTTTIQYDLDPVFLDDNSNITTNRTVRQEDLDNVDENKNDSNNKDKENQNEEDEEEEEPNMVTGLISAFLSGLSRPDGSVDVEAITALLGSLSTENPDGSYNFQGLTDLLMSFFGGGGEEGGGSDFGAFLGGLLGAFIQGVANPPGAKGSGIFVGNLLNGVLPALSAPAPTEEDSTQKPQPTLDSGGFLGGLLSSILGSSGGLSSSSSGSSGGGGGSKFSLFKAIFSMITSIFSSSSASN